MMQAISAPPGTWTGTIDIQTLFFRLTLDSATEFLFGESVESQVAAMGKDPDHEDKDFVYAFERSQWYLTKASHYGEYWWMGHNKEFRDLCAQVHAFVDQFVRKALNQETKEKAPEKDSSEKEKYIFLEALAAQTQDPVELRNQLLNILLAGRDTTASFLGWIFLLLAKHPEVCDKLRTEVVDQFGTYDDPKNLSFETLKNCSYLQWCMNETLRLFPNVPFNGRQAVRDTTIPFGGGPDGNSPVFVPKGDCVSYSVSWISLSSPSIRRPFKHSLRNTGPRYAPPNIPLGFRRRRIQT
jgi:cytochrome P450